MYNSYPIIIVITARRVITLSIPIPTKHITMSLMESSPKKQATPINVKWETQAAQGDFVLENQTEICAEL